MYMATMQQPTVTIKTQLSLLLGILTTVLVFFLMTTNNNNESSSSSYTSTSSTMTPESATTLSASTSRSSIDTHSTWYEMNLFQTCSVRNSSLVDILASDPHLSSHPQSSIINPLAFKLMADVYYGKGAIPDGYGEILNKKRLEYVITCLQPGAVIFVVTRSLRTFFDRYYDRIMVPFVLVSGDSDLNVPKGVLSPELIARVLLADNSKIIQWYAMNCDSNPAPGRFRCLPNGISQWNGQLETMNEVFGEGIGVAQYLNNNNTVPTTVTTVTKTNSKKSDAQRRPQLVKNESYSILVSFSVDSNQEVRRPAWDFLCPNAPNNHLLLGNLGGTGVGSVTLSNPVIAASVRVTAATAIAVAAAVTTEDKDTGGNNAVPIGSMTSIKHRKMNEVAVSGKFKTSAASGPGLSRMLTTAASPPSQSADSNTPIDSSLSTGGRGKGQSSVLPLSIMKGTVTSTSTSTLLPSPPPSSSSSSYLLNKHGSIHQSQQQQQQPVKDKPYAHCSFLRPISQHEFYHQLAESKFVLSPHGRGLDCYRTYEALCLGSFVVVKSSSLDEIYEGLPVLIVDRWEQITEELLNNTYLKFQNIIQVSVQNQTHSLSVNSTEKKFQYEKLFAKYWLEQFHSHGYATYMYRRGPLSYLYV